MERAEPWLDPDDRDPNRRTAKEVAGWRSHDVVKTLSKRSNQITRAFRSGRDGIGARDGGAHREHCVAADCYRLSAEMAEGGARGVQRYEDFGEPRRQFFQPGSGPTDTKMAHLAAFASVNKRIGSPWALSLLSDIVLSNTDVTSWATKRGWSVKGAVGALTIALDLLVTVFEDQVSVTAMMEGFDLEPRRLGGQA